MQRMGMVLGLKPEKVEEYVRLHAAVWPDVLEM
ncbi:MAG: L-rhamnose mutarotase, partial [Mesorhizobium sp.]